MNGWWSTHSLAHSLTYLQTSTPAIHSKAPQHCMPVPHTNIMQPGCSFGYCISYCASSVSVPSPVQPPPPPPRYSIENTIQYSRTLLTLIGIILLLLLLLLWLPLCLPEQLKVCPHRRRRLLPPVYMPVCAFLGSVCLKSESVSVSDCPLLGTEHGSATLICIHGINTLLLRRRIGVELSELESPFGG